MEKILFYILAFIALVSAVLTVTTTKIYRAVLYLLFALLSIAGIYFMMNFDFIGAVQLSVYAGGIMVLFIYMVMLTERPGEPMRKIAPFRRLIAGITVISLMILALIAIWKYDFPVADQSRGITVEEVGKAMLNYGEGGFILPFEVISVLLLAVMVAAIVIAKNKKEKINS